ncbi:MAG: MEDS domain-containing protein, partial [Bacteroidota bacterium]|nr:MEDS domain-containing protein [Bacteroidota bacterium]
MVNIKIYVYIDSILYPVKALSHNIETYLEYGRGKILRKSIANNPGLFSKAQQNSQISAVYEDAEEFTELLVTYFKEGIEGGEYCLLISPDKLSTERAKSELKKAGVDVEHSLAFSQLEILPANSSPENLTLLASTIKELAEKEYEKALSEGFSGFRMSFDFKSTGNSLKPCLETCEKVIEKMAFENNKTFTFLCTLPLEEISGRALLELMEENSVFAKRKGRWK